MREFRPLSNRVPRVPRVEDEVTREGAVEVAAVARVVRMRTAGGR